jgi:hypothetical protein
MANNGGPKHRKEVNSHEEAVLCDGVPGFGGNLAYHFSLRSEI